MATDFLGSLAQPAPPTAGSVSFEEYPFLHLPGKKPNPFSQSSPPASIANGTWSRADAALLSLPGRGLQPCSVPSFHLMPGLAQRAVKGLFSRRLLTVESFLSSFWYYIPPILARQLLASPNILSVLKRKTRALWNWKENSGCSCVTPRMGLNPQ